MPRRPKQHSRTSASNLNPKTPSSLSSLVPASATPVVVSPAIASDSEDFVGSATVSSSVFGTANSSSKGTTRNNKGATRSRTRRRGNKARVSPSHLNRMGMGFDESTSADEEEGSSAAMLDKLHTSRRRPTARNQMRRRKGSKETEEEEDEEEEEEELVSSDAALEPETNAELAAALSQPLLTELPRSKRWQDWWTRSFWALIMLSGFALILASGHLVVILMVIGIQTMVFKEVIAIAHVPSKEKKLPWFGLTNWYFLGVTNYYLYGETLISHFKENFLIDALLLPFATHHRFISFTLYVLGFVFFVMNLKKGHYRFQFMQFFWTHMTLLVVTFQSHFIINNILEGLIWFVIPVMCVVANDLFAYVCGFFFGRTRLIRLSPKKTWEGFIGGFICTLLFALIMSGIVIKWPYFICPAKDLSTNAWSNVSCEINPVFIPARYHLPPALMSLARHVLRANVKYVYIAPMQWHTLLMACFASSIAPFGGFFASGFKRAFKLKDFGQSIPGHGGITDRNDCQFLMGFFSYIYYQTFIKTSQTITVANLLQQAVDGLDPSAQLELYQGLQEYLRGRSMLE